MEMTQTIPAAGGQAEQQKTAEYRDRLLSPLPRIQMRGVVAALAAVIIVVWSLRGTKAEPATLIAGVPNMIDFVTRLFPIEFDWTAIAKLPIEVQLPFTIRATSFTDTLDGNAEMAAIEAALAEQVPLDELLARGEAMPETSIVETPVQAAPDAWLSLTPSTWNRIWVPGILPYVIETLQMALVGTAMAVILSIPFGLFAARNTTPHPAVYQVVRLLMNANRAVPELITALIFVAAVGLGPFTGVLALGVASVGSLGRLYAEAIEQIDPQQVLAVRATGANALHVFRYAVLPQVLPLVATYSLTYFEHNVRAATILGVVGAGGVGLRLNQYIGLFQFRELMGAVLVLVIAVTLIDRLSAGLRSRII